MIKDCFVGFLSGVNEIEADRWYFRFHGPEAKRYQEPWFRRYETYRAYTPPPEAKRFGAVDGRLTEQWYSNLEDWLECYTCKMAFTPLPGPQRISIPARTIAPARQTEDFLGKEPRPEEQLILRWYRVFKYPEGVSRETGDKWYLDVHSQQVKEQPGLLKYVSHRTIDKQPYANPWQRIDELWYDNFDAWRKANIESPPKYTPPPWGGQAPFVDMVSIFIKLKPDVDFLKDNPRTP